MQIGITEEQKHQNVYADQVKCTFTSK